MYNYTAYLNTIGGIRAPLGPRLVRPHKNLCLAHFTQHSYITHVKSVMLLFIWYVHGCMSFRSSSVAQQTRPQHHIWLHHCFVIVVMISNVTFIVVTGTSGCCKLHTSNSQNTTVTQTYHFHILLTQHLVLLNMFHKCFSDFLPFQKITPGLRHQLYFLL